MKQIEKLLLTFLCTHSLFHSSPFSDRLTSFIGSALPHFQKEQRNNDFYLAAIALITSWCFKVRISDFSFRGPATHICHTSTFLYMSITNDWSLEGSTHRPSYLRSRSSRASLPSTARADGTQCSSCSRYCGFRETCPPTESSPVQVKLGNSNKQKECAKV